MAIQQEFEQALAESKQLKTRPDNNTLLKLYSLYKQANDGDAPADSGVGMFDFVGKAKHDAWKKLSGLSADNAMQQYIELVQQLKNAG